VWCAGQRWTSRRRCGGGEASRGRSLVETAWGCHWAGDKFSAGAANGPASSCCIAQDRNRLGIATLTFDFGCVVATCTYCAAATWVSPASDPTCGDVYTNSCPLVVGAPEYPSAPAGPRSRSVALAPGRYDLSAKAILNSTLPVVLSPGAEKCSWMIRLSYPR
jgi:hypothetical protein